MVEKTINEIITMFEELILNTKYQYPKNNVNMTWNMVIDLELEW